MLVYRGLVCLVNWVVRHWVVGWVFSNSWRTRKVLDKLRNIGTFNEDGSSIGLLETHIWLKLCALNYYASPARHVELVLCYLQPYVDCSSSNISHVVEEVGVRYNDVGCGICLFVIHPIHLDSPSEQSNVVSESGCVDDDGSSGIHDKDDTEPLHNRSQVTQILRLVVSVLKEVLVVPCLLVASCELYFLSGSVLEIWYGIVFVNLVSSCEDLRDEEGIKWQCAQVYFDGSSELKDVEDYAFVHEDVYFNDRLRGSAAVQRHG